MSETYDLSKLDAATFEHLVNLIAMKVLGPGHTGFGPGSDGGRDGYYEGKAPYPSSSDQWSGKWYIQSKFHYPHLSNNPQKWLINQVKEEIAEFEKPESKRVWPDNWILATNIDPSGAPETGAFDQIKRLIKQANPKLETRFHVWGGRKILDFLVINPDIVNYYRHAITPGSVLTELIDSLKDERADIESILRFLVVKQLGEQQFTKLEQAGSNSDNRPGIHRLFVDLPFKSVEHNLSGFVMKYLSNASAKTHIIDADQSDTKEWKLWRRNPSRGRVWFIKGGPGQGKSTIGQYFSQIQRAALILQKEGFTAVMPNIKSLSREIVEVANASGILPAVPRIPVSIELKEFAQWYGKKEADKGAKGIITYIAKRISDGIEQKVYTGTLKRALQNYRWLFVFDGLDEVPQDVKDAVAIEVLNFVNDIAFENNADILSICTSRPQGYSGQFSDVDGPTIDLTPLSPELALMCAEPILKLERSNEESRKSFQILSSAINSPSVKQLMTTPLQSHIMAVVVRDGGRPPERRWQLFNNFYQVIKRRESNRNLPDLKLAKLLREDEQLLKTVHNRLGFTLHSSAETSGGAQTHLNKSEFRELVKIAVSQMVETNISETVNILMEATTERLVLVSTPDDGNHVRFDIRSLQEFFAAEFLYESVSADVLRNRISFIAGDSHWTEVMHFLMSALIENDRRTELAVAIEELEFTNQGDGNINSQLLNKKLAKGAILAARLLQEGVLEQDRRVRQQFRKCLEPLTSCTDQDVLRPLTQINLSNSKTWLIDFLISSLREQSPAENIGAAIILCHILPDGNQYNKEVKTYLLESSPEYITEIILKKSPFEFRIGKTVSFQDWYIEFMIELLLGDQWTKLRLESFRSILRSLSENKEKVYNIAIKLIKADAIELLKGLIEDEDLEDKETINLGIVFCSYYLNKWCSPSFKFRNWIDKVPKKASESTGILQLIYRILKFAETKKLEDLLSVLNLISVNLDIYQIVPTYLLAYLPIDPHCSLFPQIEFLNHINDSQFEIFLEKQSKSLSNSIVMFTAAQEEAEKFTMEHWKKMNEIIPDLAYQFWGTSLWKNVTQMKRPSFLDDEESMKILFDSVVKSPEKLLPRTASIGRLLTKIDETSQEGIRKLLSRIAAESLVSRNHRISYDIHPFKINLPEDSCLLPHLLSSLIAPPNDFELFSQKRDSENQIKKFSSVISSFIDDHKKLDKIINDPKTKNEIKAAALLILILHPKSKSTFINRRQEIVNFYSTTIGYWYLRVVSGLFTLLNPFEIAVGREIMGDLLDVARNDFEGRKYLNQVLSDWRGISSAPIQTNNLQLVWLSE